MKMTPRERVMASVNHQNPDSLPMDLGSNVSAGISGMAYGKLKEYLGINRPQPYLRCGTAGSSA